jgi:ATP-dependent DNA helicase RecQ
MIESKMVIKEPSPSNEDVQLFNTLKKKRLELANAAGVPAFCIATNRSLRSMVSIKPKTLVELKTVFGFGQHKVSVYGQKFIDLIV